MKRILPWMVIVTLVGCNAIRTEMWTRDENDFLHPDSEISPDLDDDLNGIPVMLKVPSHIEVVIKQKLYAYLKDNKLKYVKLKRPDLSVDADLKYTEKMFLVDPVRVASGTGAYGFGFGGSDGSQVQNANKATGLGHGYLDSASYKAVDTTITTSATLLSTILSFAPTTAKKSSVENASEFGLITIERVVAFRRFDLASPTVDEDVFTFLQENMNCCHSCDLKLDCRKTADTHTSTSKARTLTRRSEITGSAPRFPR